MQGWKRWFVGLGMVLGMAASRVAVAEDTEPEVSRVEQLARELKELRAELAAARRVVVGPTATDEQAELGRRVEVLAAEIERLKLGEVAASADASGFGFGPAASKVYRARAGVSIGGYGEMLYEHFADEREDGSKVARADRVDFLRAIVYFGYKFDDRWLFNSEIEFEHGSTEDEGSVSVEFAYLDYRWRPQANLRAGLMLVPMGHLNELHEPTTFLSTVRPETERRILPSTWRENGFGLYGALGSLTYRTYVLNGFDSAGFSAGGLRDGRQNGSKALAEGLAWVARVDHERPGFVVGGAIYTGKAGQSVDGGPGVSTTIVEGHLTWRHRGLWLRALAAQAVLGDVGELNRELGRVDGDSVGEKLSGGYVEIGYDVLSGHGPASLTPFARWESLDTQRRVPAGFARNPVNQQDFWTLGLAFRPIDQVVFKLDYRDASNGAQTAVDQCNLSVGYIF